MSCLMTIVVILLSFAFSWVSSIVDSEHVNDGDYIEDHTSRSYLRLLFFVALMLANPLYGLVSALIFAGTFDQFFNYNANKDSIWYLGTTAEWDKFWGVYPKAYIGMKILSILAAGFFAYLTL